jgi:hypothetical protein
MLSFRGGRQNDGNEKLAAMSGAQDRLCVRCPADGAEVISAAAKVLAEALAVAPSQAIAVEWSHRLPARTLEIGTPRDECPIGAIPAEVAVDTDAFAIARPDGDSILLAGGTERAVMHAAYALLERLGAPYQARARIDRDRLARVEPFTVVPAFSRRAIVSDIMTWHYETPERLAMHLESDAPFIEWMGAFGLNAFSYIRHTVDSRLKIDELLPLYRARGVDSEYGGHVLQLLLPRDRFGANPGYFPADASGARNPRGNLCVSNADALALVRDAAIRYARDNPECALLHVWGADVWEGAWCRCNGCAALSPQSQYMKVVNAIAEALAGEGAPPVAYLAYHDTIEPDSALRPLPNVSFEWAPRERCYSHAIDDAACEINPRYWKSLKRYMELFDGRGHVFEYYADAILFGGIAAASPSIIARDLRAYRALGLGSVSCLTFGLHSALAYPVNLEAFARATRSPDFEPDETIAGLAARRYPACSAEMADAYRAIARASMLILDGGGDVMRPKPKTANRAARIAALKLAHDDFTRAIEAADHVMASGGLDARGERGIWCYSREIAGGICEYLAASAENGPARGRRRDASIDKIAGAIEQLRAAAPSAKNAWAAYDLEWIRPIWLDALRRRFDDAGGEKS